MMNPVILNHFSRRREFIQMLAERGAKKGVEIGTDHGEYAKQLLEGIPGLKLTCVDPWVAYTEGNEIHTKEEVDQIYKQALETLRNYDTKLMKMTSMEAVKWIPDNSLDFVFIDGNHSYENVLEDITEWSKKVKPGGIIAGHDYVIDLEKKYGVIEAVSQYVKENHIAPLFILHVPAHVPKRSRGNLVDCYMWIKQ